MENLSSLLYKNHFPLIKHISHHNSAVNEIKNNSSRDGEFCNILFHISNLFKKEGKPRENGKLSLKKHTENGAERHANILFEKRELSWENSSLD